MPRSVLANATARRVRADARAPWRFVGGAAWLLAACGDAVVDGAHDAAAADAAWQAGDSADSFREVTAILERSCAYQRCHAGPIVGGGLSFALGNDYWAALVGVEACQFDGMKRVEPGDPERSWLMVKLTARFRPAGDPYATYIYFEPPAGWDPTRRGCPDQTEDGTPLFGQRMPATAPNMLSEGELTLIRRWIEAGAPR